MHPKTKPFLAIVTIGMLGAFWALSAPRPHTRTPAFEQPGDPVKGQIIFSVGGCASCHMEKVAKGDARLRLGGGQVFTTPFGAFTAPNISPDVNTGIGGWSAYDLANAVTRGVSPQGTHYYPAFPYGSYSRVSLGDIIDLKAYLDTLPEVSQANIAHDLPLPFRWRRVLGLWKQLFMREEPIIQTPEARGQYLVEGLGHCGECHSPRNILGGIDTNRWLAGAPNPEGRGRIPNITPHAQGLSDWSLEDIASYLESGFRPDFDTAGGTMVEVVENLSHLSNEDRLAIARYLKSIPALANAPPN